MSNKKDSLGDRMKTYESVPKHFLMRRTPVIIRIDGKAFHTFTKRFERPFSDVMHTLMVHTTEHLVRNIQNAVLGYTQSDEISILLNDWKTLETDQWFNGNVQKMASVSASMATGYFNAAYHEYCDSNSDSQIDFMKETAFFDSRVYNVPHEDVVNYFVWRQQDASRNSVQMLGRAYFSHKQLHAKNNSQIQDILMLEKGVNWNDIETWKKRGTCVQRIIVRDDGIIDLDSKWQTVKPRIVVDDEIPIFTQVRGYVSKHLTSDEE